MIEQGTALKAALGALLATKAAKAGLIPFILATGAGPTLNFTRIAEAVIIAGLTAGASVYSTTQVLKVRIDKLDAQVAELADQLKDMRHDLYKPRLSDGRLFVGPIQEAGDGH